MTTIRMIAEKCEVSLTTVSKALHDAPDVSEKTKQRIREVALSMGYRPNVAAKALRTNRSYSFGIIFEEATKQGFTHEFFSQILNSFLNRSQVLGYDVFFLGDSLGGRSIRYAEHADYRNCDGILVIAASNIITGIVDDVRKSSCPIVCLDYETEGISSICSDNRQGMHDLMAYIASQGHRRVAFLHGEDTPVTRTRVETFRTESEALGFSTDPAYLRQVRYHDPHLCQKAFGELLALPTPPTCIMLPDDISAFGALNECHRQHLRIPEDICLTGYDGISLSEYLVPHLTTLRQDAENMGASAADILAGHAGAGRPTEPVHCLVPGILIPGETVCRIPS